ncbi:hypothetical protein [Bilophila sp.]|uniref:hypothetical protein n=1 Tax=Bilophila sp. TaxID=1929485 RepID=UPI003078772E
MCIYIIFKLFIFIRRKTLAAPQKMVDAFFLKLQRNNRQNALAVDSAKGKTKKAVFSPGCGDETATCPDRAKPFPKGYAIENG